MQLLKIAEGTEYEITVWDVREDYVWADPSWDKSKTPHEQFYWHHFGVDRREYQIETTPSNQLDLMLRERDVAPFGLPYNLIMWNTGWCRIWYINDVDIAYPHTYAHNDDLAIAVPGNFDFNIPIPALTVRGRRLTMALRNLWPEQGWIQSLGHRDVYPTACPGANLYPIVRSAF